MFPWNSKQMINHLPKVACQGVGGHPLKQAKSAPPAMRSRVSVLLFIQDEAEVSDELAACPAACHC